MQRSKKDNQKLITQFDYTQFEQEALAGLMAGKSLIGEQGILKGLIQHLVECALDGEMDAHLSAEKSKGKANRRNGHTRKNLRTMVGEVSIQPPRDRAGSFTPQLVSKWERDLDSGLERQILELYSMGNSYEDIRSHVLQMYGVKLSVTQISAITDRVWKEIHQWQQRVLQSFYMVVFLDAIHFKIRTEGVVKTRAVYTVYGVDAEGYRDVLSIEIGEEEGAKHWGRVLEKLQERGVEDVLFFAIDGLSGFRKAIESVFPNSIVQRCIVHMVRSSIKFVAEKDMGEVIADLKAIYTSDTEQQALSALNAFEKKWNDKYASISKAWRSNWMELTAFFGYNRAVKKMIYTTNPIENLHRMMRKTTKTKGAFVSEQALEKLLYLTLKKKRKVWERRIHSTKSVQRCLEREFGERYTKHLNK